jgi:hypothetical protein
LCVAIAQYPKRNKPCFLHTGYYLSDRLSKDLAHLPVFNGAVRIAIRLCFRFQTKENTYKALFSVTQTHEDRGKRNNITSVSCYIPSSGPYIHQTGYPTAGMLGNGTHYFAVCFSLCQIYKQQFNHGNFQSQLGTVYSQVNIT